MEWRTNGGEVVDDPPTQEVGYGGRHHCVPHQAVLYYSHSWRMGEQDVGVFWPLPPSPALSILNVHFRL